jgi:predicted transcriptional regulator
MSGLGPLETAIMDVLWRAGQPMRVREVLDLLTTERTLAYTTVMTVLDNLHRKAWVVRDLDGRAYQYRPARSREEAAVLAMRELIAATGDPEAVLLHFGRSASDREVAVLRRAIRGRATGS